MTCAFERDGPPYACGFYAGYAAGRDGLARSTDGGATFAPVMLFSDVQRAVDCRAETERAIACEALWADWVRELGAGADGGSRDGGGASGMVRITSMALPGGMDAGPVGALRPPTAVAQGGGCDCGMGAGVGRSGWGLLALALALRRRRGPR